MGRLWWEGVPNAARLIRFIGECLEDRKSVLFLAPEMFPWRDTFQEMVEGYQRQRISSYGMDFFEDEEDREPGEIIFMKYCKRELRDEYRPAIGYPKFLADAKTIPLNNTIVWLRSKSVDRAERWTEFVSKYQLSLGKGESGGLFIIETNVSDSLKKKMQKGVTHVDYNDFVTPFDVYIFCILASSVLPLSRESKEYMAEVATSLLRDDIELAGFCLNERYHASFVRDPYEVIQKVCSSEVRSDGTGFIYKLDQMEYDQRLWNAQIKCLFPRIESYREWFTKKNYKNIERCLPITNSSGEVYDKPEDVELGTLFYMAGSRMIQINQTEYDRLYFYKDCRNKLAHLEQLSIEEVDTLLTDTTF